MKLKLGITFAALVTLFNVHRTSAARVFYDTVNSLHGVTDGWVKWFPKHVIQETMPHTFKVNYPKCRVIIDCSEVRIEKPQKVANQVLCWSNYKHDFTTKFLIGVAPSGYISFVSNAYGGRTSDTDITSNCGLLELLEPGDVVLADKGFPHIKCCLEKKNVTLVIPTFARPDEQFTEAENCETYKVASVRIHVERCIQRVKVFSILRDRLSARLLKNVDKILHTCCVLANMQAPIFRHHN